MKFGPLTPAEAQGAVLVHKVRAGELSFKKGHRLSADDIAALSANGCQEIVVARLEEGDVGEDEAAYEMALALGGQNIRCEAAFTGRSNLFATAAGLLQIDCMRVDAINGRDERLTFATLPPLRRVVEGEMVGTVKIIPFALPRGILNDALALTKADGPVVRVVPFQPQRVAVISTLLPSLKSSTIDKTLHALAHRLMGTGAEIICERRVAHDTTALAAALNQVQAQADLVIVFGASAITDRRDVIPAAVEAIGGRIEQLGMPVDPGNLLLLGACANGVPVVGAPGCARSPVENGFDWVLHRLLAGLKVEARDIRAMGVGGLLMEIISRPQPRAGGEGHEQS